MKHLGILGVLVMAVMALSGYLGASAASATALYNGTTKLGAGATVDYSNSGISKITNTAGTETLDECTGSTINGTITNPGGAGTNVQISINEFTWTGCVVPTTTDLNGGISSSQIGTSTEGTVRSNAETGVTMNTVFYGVCRYGVPNGVHLGILQTSASGTATFDVRAVTVKQPGSNFLCPESTRWVATYKSTTPDNERVEAS